MAGGLIAGLLFVIPGALLILALATLYASFGAVGWVDALFVGVKAAVVVIVIEALLKVSKRALKRRDHWGIAAVAFVAIFFFNLPFPLLVAAAAAFGFLTASKDVIAEQSFEPIRFRQTMGTVVLWLAIWWLPLAALALVAPNSVLVAIGLFFAKLAVVTFGGAYAVLAYMAQQVVEMHHWLDAGQMIDGLGLAETTPGAVDFGDRVRWLSGSLWSRGVLAWRCRCHCRALDDLRAVFSVDIRRCALHQPVVVAAQIAQFIDGGDSQCGWGDPEPDAVVCAACSVC